MTDDLFSNVILRGYDLLSYGFMKEPDGFLFKKPLHDGEFLAEIHIDSTLSKVSGHIYDLEFHDEYTDYKTLKATPFALGIREEYENLLKDIIGKCGTKGLYQTSQADRVDSFMMEEYKPLREFPFSDYPSFGTYKNPKGKWFALIMDFPYSKLNKEKEGSITVINLKISGDEKLFLHEGIYPAFHMNKKNWISVALDDTLKDSDVIDLIRESYHNVLVKKP